MATYMTERGECTATSLREEIGERDPDFMFSLRGLDARERDSAHGVLGIAVMDDPPEALLAIQVLRLAKGRRPRCKGVLARPAGLFLADHELYRTSPAWFLTRGYLLLQLVPPAVPGCFLVLTKGKSTLQVSRGDPHPLGMDS